MEGNDRSFPSFYCTENAGLVEPAGFPRQSRGFSHRLLGCAAVILPVPSGSDAEVVKHFHELNSKIELPIVLYNTKHSPLKSVECVQELDKLESIAGIKDSSQNLSFFKELVALKSKGKLRFALLQGMENQLYESLGCDGFLLSLLNVEPELCAKMLQSPSKELNAKILSLFTEYDLDKKDWYVSLKTLLHARGIIRSSERVKIGV